MPSHIIFHTLPAWSHTKPLISLTVLLAESRQDVVLTFFAGAMYPKIIKQLAQLPPEHLEKIEGRIRIIDVAGPGSDPRQPTFEFVPAFEEVYKHGTAKCLSTGKSFDNLPKPTLAIIDPFAAYAVEGIRGVASPQDVPVFAWISGPVGATIREFGPESLGSRGDLWGQVEKEVTQTGGNPLEIGEKLYTACKSELVHIPGYPAMYDYEWFPQDQDLSVSALLLRTGRKYLHETEGTFSVTTSILEPEATKAMSDYMHGLGKEFVSIGFIADTFPLKQGQSRAENDDSVLEFLDKMKARFGENSVLYIAFGSIWWPKDPSKLFIVIEELIKNHTPFLLACASPSASLPEQVQDQIVQSGIGMSVDWAPQDQVLKHPATGWFVTHAGWNSIQEGFRYRIPMIVWPFSADQPLNAALMVEVHKTALELLEVRTGEMGLKKLHRLDRAPLGTDQALRDEVQILLKKLKGNEGTLVRTNVERLGEEIKSIWTERGESRVELEQFLQKFID
ncbi:glycosyltransferase family 1 protein [Moniliophthora roreri]|nr:glycosyltransferase family 1 protein [Moniliophthora roreri]